MCIPLQASSAPSRGLAPALCVPELRYRRLFEMARDGLLILDSDEGKITDTNHSLAELLGCSRSEMLGRELWEVGLLESSEAAREALSRLRQDGCLRYELSFETQRGDKREVEVVSNLYRENGHAVIQCSVCDVTERKRVEARLTAAAQTERIAETLQRCLLQSPAAGQFPGLTVEALYRAAPGESPIGGDFYDAFALNENEVALVVGDVAGKGLIAAGRTAEVKYALRAFLHEHRTPSHALAHLNDFICETHRCDLNYSEVFITLALVVVNASTGETTLASAGAEPTLVLRGDGSVEPVEIVGLPLGIRPDVAYATETLLLEVGETILMVTDGITEARRGAAFLGIEGVAALAGRAGPEVLLSELIHLTYGGACDFADGRLHDDACLLLARR